MDNEIFDRTERYHFQCLTKRKLPGKKDDFSKKENYREQGCLVRIRDLDKRNLDTVVCF